MHVAAEGEINHDNNNHYVWINWLFQIVTSYYISVQIGLHY